MVAWFKERAPGSPRLSDRHQPCPERTHGTGLQVGRRFHPRGGLWTLWSASHEQNDAKWVFSGTEVPVATLFFELKSGLILGQYLASIPVSTDRRPRRCWTSRQTSWGCCSHRVERKAGTVPGFSWLCTCSRLSGRTWGRQSMGCPHHSGGRGHGNAYTPEPSADGMEAVCSPG